jgi:glycosyltransferase involved in cell wall biosynthesis
MNIGLDARTIFSPRPRGTGRNLFDAYQLIPALRPGWRFTLYHQRPASHCPLVAGNGKAARWPVNVRLRRIEMPGDRFAAWFHLRLPLAAWRDRLDLLHLPANAAPAWCPVPMVVTIHDLIPLKLPDELPPRERRRFRRGILRAVRAASHIITPSRATRDDLCSEFNVPQERISVVPWAPDRLVTDASPSPDDLVQLRQRYGLNRPWVLNFSGAGRRKNACGILAALALLPEALRRRFLWVLVGVGRQQRVELLSQAVRLGVAADCRLLDFVPHQDVPGLLSGAVALLIPSLYEGFGLPVLDAFACGIPVLAGQFGSLPEVAGDAALYCDPRYPESIAAGIAQLLEPQVSRVLADRGRQRVRSFTWQRTAEAMCAAYERCLVAAGRLAAARAGATCR